MAPFGQPAQGVDNVDKDVQEVAAVIVVLVDGAQSGRQQSGPSIVALFLARYTDSVVKMHMRIPSNHLVKEFVDLGL